VKETGTVNWYKIERGYGFITRDAGGDIFVHYTGIHGDGFTSLERGQKVEFSIRQNEKGPCAENVVVVH